MTFGNGLLNQLLHLNQQIGIEHFGYGESVGVFLFPHFTVVKAWLNAFALEPFQRLFGHNVFRHRAHLLNRELETSASPSVQQTHPR
ncbi:Uncharacterised protein [Vibrio cholerae]|nr:Uncharacterised protein [Vibrio cholerae]